MADLGGVPLVTRGEAGLRAPTRTQYLPARNVVECVLHHGGDATAAVTVAEQLRRWGGYQRYHMNSRGWSDIAYNFGLLLDGRLVEGRGLTAEGGATGRPVDDRSISVCAIGNYDTEQSPTDAQIATMRRLHTVVWPARFPNYRRLAGHHDYGKQACPGTAFRTRWAEMTTPAPAPEPPPDEGDDDMALPYAFGKHNDHDTIFAFFGSGAIRALGPGEWAWYQRIHPDADPVTTDNKTEYRRWRRAARRR